MYQGIPVAKHLNANLLVFVAPLAAGLLLNTLDWGAELSVSILIISVGILLAFVRTTWPVSVAAAFNTIAMSLQLAGQGEYKSVAAIICLFVAVVLFAVSYSSRFRIS